MARLVPKVEVEAIANAGERVVARALVEQLPDDFVVYHSYPWLNHDRNDIDRRPFIREGEVDFLIVDPDHGILVLEVKGGQIAYDAPDHLWYRQLGQRRKQIKDPFAQARDNLHYLTDLVIERSFPAAKTPPFARGFAVVFPDCVFQGDMPGGAEEAIVLAADDLPRLGASVQRALVAWDRRPGAPRLGQRVMEGIVKALSPSFQLLPVLFRTVEEQEEKLVRLTQRQLELLEFLGDHERAVIEGVAGSGKTLLALAQTQRFADVGRETLFVCYNKALAQWVRDALPEHYSERVTVRHFHSLCAEWCRKAGIAFPAKSGSDTWPFWRVEAAELLVNAVEAGADKFDAVVVDEGQDFEDLWWYALTQLQRDQDSGPFYVFYDPAQNLFVDDGCLPDLGRPFQLPTNCRNTKRIAELCGDIRHVRIPTRDDAPEGSACEVRTAASPAEQRRLCGEYVRKWVTST